MHSREDCRIGFTALKDTGEKRGVYPCTG